MKVHVNRQDWLMFCGKIITRAPIVIDVDQFESLKARWGDVNICKRCRQAYNAWRRRTGRD